MDYEGFSVTLTGDDIQHYSMGKCDSTKIRVPKGNSISSEFPTLPGSQITVELFKTQFPTVKKWVSGFRI